MNISSTRIQSPTFQPPRTRCRGNSESNSSETDTFRMSRSEKRNYITAGAALGSFAMANLTQSLAGTGAKVFGGASGALAGAAMLGITGGIVAGALSKDEGFGGLAASYAGALIGAAAGAIGGGIGGAMLGTGAGNALGYAAGALAGGVVGGFAAHGMMKN